MDNKTNNKPGVSLRLVGRYESETAHAHLRACEQITARHSEIILEDFLSALDLRLEAFAQRAATNDELRRLDDTMRLLRAKRGELLETFQGHLSECFTLFQKQQLDTRISQTPKQPERLSLVDNDVLEENIALSSIAYRTEDAVRTDLWFLSQRLSVLNSGRKVRDNNNPLSPLQFCYALRATLSEHPIQIREKLLAYKVFEGSLHGNYAALVAEINEYLAAQGILPNLRLLDGTRQTADGPLDAGDAGSDLPVQDSPLPDGQAAEVPAGSGEAMQSDGELIQAIRTLQQYLQQGAPQSGAGPQAGGSPASGTGMAQGAGPSNASSYSSQQLVDMLHAVQTQALGAEDFIAATSGGKVVLPRAESLKQNVVAQLQDQGLDPADMHTIDLVGMIFEYMLSDEQLPDSVKTLLSYLHTPFLKIAFLDADFFEQKDHPARLLLNALAEAGTRWVGNDGTSQYDMFAKIKDVVSRVLEKFENDVRLFAELLFEFSADVKKIARRQELMEKRAMERFQGEERLREAKIQVNREVRARIKGKELPSAVLLLLLQPWSAYLAFLLLRHGEKSASWQQALEAIDDIVQSIQTPPESAVLNHKAQQKQVLKMVKEGLASIGYDQTRSEKMLEALGSLQQMALQRKQAAPAPAPVRSKLEAEAAEKAGDTSEAREKISPEERRMVEHLKMIEFGTWFEFEGGKRLKVAWYNSKTMHYMLVNQMGRQVALKSGLELARDMLAGKARVIAGSTKPFFERALENILQNLNAKAGHTESDDNG